MNRHEELGRDVLEAGIIKWIIGRNGERDRRILGMYLFDGITYEQMQDRLEAEGYLLSIDGLKRVIKKRKAQLFRHI